MLIIDNVIQKASKDLSNKELYRACFNVCEYIKNTKPSLLQHINYSTLYTASKAENEELLLQTIQYLTGARTQVLDSAYELFYDDFPIQIEKSYLVEADREGVFVHPDTGEIIDNYQSFIEIYFKLSDKASKA
jgi:hypothetical protein